MNNYLITVNNLDIYNELKKVGYTTFLFPLEGFSIGYNTFKLDDIEALDSINYLLINRILDTKSIDELKVLLKDLTNIKGIVFEDIGLLNILDKNKLDLIYFSNHHGTNYETIKLWLNMGINSVVLSNEITEDEIKEITNKIPNKLTMIGYGHNQVMYSRRNLLSNYQCHYNLALKNTANLKTMNNEFLMVESEFGTVMYTKEIYNYLSLDVPLYKTIINTTLLSDEETLKLLNSIKDNHINDILPGESKGFLDTETIYRLGDLDE